LIKPQVCGLAEFKEIVKEIAAADPTHVYRQLDNGKCSYSETPKELGCIIGLALVALGADQEWLQHVDRENRTSTANVVLADLGFDRSVQVWARAVQYAQDTGVAWGQAVKVTKREERLFFE
jgi:hypothetical protein